MALPDARTTGVAQGAVLLASPAKCIAPWMRAARGLPATQTKNGATKNSVAPIAVAVAELNRSDVNRTWPYQLNPPPTPTLFSPPENEPPMVMFAWLS
jgi:hypothetical protein